MQTTPSLPKSWRPLDRPCGEEHRDPLSFQFPPPRKITAEDAEQIAKESLQCRREFERLTRPMELFEHRGKGLRVAICSQASGVFVYVSRKGRMPNLEDLGFVRNLFLGPDRPAVLILPSRGSAAHIAKLWAPPLEGAATAADRPDLALPL